MTSLRFRILLLLSIAGLALLGTAYWVQQRLLLPSFLSLERQTALADLQRGQEALAGEIQVLSDFLSDWAGWDATYRFMEGRNPDYVASNLGRNAFRSTSFDFLSFVAPDGSEVWRGAMWNDQPIEVAELPSGRWPTDNALLTPRPTEVAQTSVVVTAHGPLLLSSRPVTDSARTAAPRGWTVMGRFLTPTRMDRLREQTRLDLSITPLAALADVAVQQHMLAVAAGEPVEVQADDTLVARALQPGLGAKDTLLLAVQLPRAILAEGRSAMAFALVTTGIAALVLFALLLIVLQTSVVGPLAQLTQHALRIRGTGDLSVTSGIVRADEIGTLAREFDGMVAQIHALQAKATQAARDGGRAEVARSVLHDVGNALQPVQAHLGGLRTRLASGHANDLERVCNMMHSQLANLGDWLERDPRGQQVPAFLQLLAGDMQSGQRAMVTDVEHIAQNLLHIQMLVDRQVGTATAAGLVEAVSLRDLVAEAVRMTTRADQVAGVVRCEVPLLQVHCEKHKLLAVVINLLRNAHHAVQALPADRRRILVRAEVIEDGRCRLVVADNGCGIPAENLTRIFQGGFSTRPGSRGLGLHGCANSVAEMGGRLWAESAGAGNGATFQLDLPIAAPVAVAVLA